MKKRLDVLLTEQGYFESREKAKAAVMAGLVFVDGQLCDKAGTAVGEDAGITVKGSSCPFVSRGGLKLEKALNVFDIKLDGAHCIDIGASTGGFTDCMLQRGAKKVYSVDVGYGQLAWSLRSDPRVVCMEKVNFRYFTPDMIDEKLDFACTDVSFISLSHILPPAAKLLRDGAFMVCLIKPQFEAGRDQVGKHGIVKDPAVHKEVILNTAEHAHRSGFSVAGLDFSPITGAKGNIEFLIKLVIGQSDFDLDAAVQSTVASAHEKLRLSSEE